MTRHFKNGIDFPSEGFVQGAIETYFRDLGFTLNADTHVDLICTVPHQNVTWHIEAKGKTKAIGLDFRTCLGQLVQRMHNRNTRHGIAMPDIEEYRRQTEQMSDWVVNELRLYWLFVAIDGSVRIVYPKGQTSDLIDVNRASIASSSNL